MSYTNVFGSDTIPPANSAYVALTLTANTTFVWSYNATDTDNTIAKIMDMTCSAGVVMTFPDATQVSEGEDFLIRNVGAETLTLKDSTAGAITTIAAGTAKYFFLTDNATAAGTWGNVTFGAGSSAAAAGDLIGYGVKAVSNTLNQSHPVSTDADNITIDATFRAKAVVSTGGACTIALGAAATLGDDFFFLYHNAGTGTATIDPSGAELFDGASTFQVQPGESLIAVCSGATWYSVGYGRSTVYQFTQLTKDVSAAGSFTLSASEASNKLLTFNGNPAGAVTIVVPNTVAIYYVQSAISTAQTITVKTAAGTGAAIAQTARAILMCDGTNVTSAQTAVATGGLSLDAGSASAPSLSFAASTNSGMFLKGATGVGFSVNGSEVVAIEAAGVTFSQALVTPALGTPASGVLTNCTGLPIATGIAGLGANVAAALAVAIGSAGAPVLFNGAGGTPSSLTGTNITGTAAGLTAGTASAVAVGGITGLGTGVATALAVNVGSAGAPVVLNGAGGTPSSMVGTNITGTAAGLTAGAVTRVAGDVLQVVYATDAGSSTSAATLTNITTSAKSITPKSDNSTLIVECVFDAAAAAGGAGVNTIGIFQLYNNTAGANIGQQFGLGVVSGAGANVQTQGPGTTAALVTNTGLTAIAFVLRAKYGSGACAVTGVNHVWKITEVKN